MFKIEAIVRPERISHVSNALEKIGCGGFHYQNITGQGKQQGVEIATGRGGSTINRSAVPKTLLTTVVTQDMKEKAIDAIITASRSSDNGEIGDGKIFITQLTQVIRVRTGEENEAAL